MALQRRAVVTNNDGGVAGLTAVVDLPTGTVAGDTIFAIIGIADSAAGITITPPAGWTQAESFNYAATGSQHIDIWTKTAGASEPSTYSFTISGTTGGANVAWCTIAAGYYSDAGGTAAVDQKATLGVTEPASGSATSASITPSVNNCRLISIFALDDSGLGVPVWAASSPAGLTQLASVSETVTNFGMALEEHDQTTAAAESHTVTQTGGDTNRGPATVILSIKEAGTTFTASGSGTITLTGSNSATFSEAISESGTITLTGTNSATYEQADGSTGTITLSGSNTATLSVTYTSAGSGTITLSGSNSVTFVGPSPPANTVLPAITGAPAYDSYGNLSLSCSTGTWTGTLPITYTYQWQEDDDGDGVFVNIPGATSSTLQVANSVTPYIHLGNAIRCVVSATNTFGTVNADSAPTILVYVSPTIAARGSVQLIADFGFALSPSLETFPDTNVYPQGEEATLNHTNPGSSSLVPADFP